MDPMTTAAFRTRAAAVAGCLLRPAFFVCISSRTWAAQIAGSRGCLRVAFGLFSRLSSCLGRLLQPSDRCPVDQSAVRSEPDGGWPRLLLSMVDFGYPSRWPIVTGIVEQLKRLYDCLTFGVAWKVLFVCVVGAGSRSQRGNVSTQNLIRPRAGRRLSGLLEVEACGRPRRKNCACVTRIRRIRIGLVSIDGIVITVAKSTCVNWSVGW